MLRSTGFQSTSVILRAGSPCYDAAGNVTNMDDYHGNDTGYVYDDAGRLTSMTAPGSKTWTFAYNALNQPTLETLPNGMATFYSYDTRNRLETIDHKDDDVGGNTVLSFDYTLDDDGNITRIDENDGGFWEYDYDDRNRLVDAVYTTAAGHDAVYAYTYDDGDNMTQKVEPFQEDFNDTNATGWTVGSGWDFSNGYATNTLAANLYKTTSDADFELTFDYLHTDVSSTAKSFTLHLRYTSTNDRVRFTVRPDGIITHNYNGGTITSIGSTSFTALVDTWYQLKIVASGSNIKVYHAVSGQELALKLNLTTTELTTSNMIVQPAASSGLQFDNFRVLASDLASTWTMTSNDANELTQMQNSAQGTTITYDYDAMGRTTEKAMGAMTAEYSWRYGSKLYQLISEFPGEESAVYEYGGNSRLRSRASLSTYDVYKWDGYTKRNVEDVSGNLKRLHLGSDGDLGYEEIDGVASCTFYILRDHLFSKRRLYDDTKTILTSTDYAPFGDIFSHYGISEAEMYARLESDGNSDILLAMYRAADVTTQRWLSRDPAGMIDGTNMYSYVRGNPVNTIDPLGLWGCTPCEDPCNDAVRRWPAELSKAAGFVVCCGGGKV